MQDRLRFKPGEIIYFYRNLAFVVSNKHTNPTSDSEEVELYVIFPDTSEICRFPYHLEYESYNPTSVLVEV